MSRRAAHQDQNKVEPARVNGKEPKRQTISEKEQQDTTETAETAQEQEPSPKTANCTFSGVVRIDLKRFTDSGINLVECASLWKNAFTFPG